jgi:HEPN domain-containing protein
MQPITLEWIDKAEGDWTSAQREYRARQRPNYDAACFHAQQWAEKYLKAKLEEAGIAFSQTHNLISLLTLALAVEPRHAPCQRCRFLQPLPYRRDVFIVVLQRHIDERGPVADLLAQSPGG